MTFQRSRIHSFCIFYFCYGYCGINSILLLVGSKMKMIFHFIKQLVSSKIEFFRCHDKKKKSKAESHQSHDHHF